MSNEETLSRELAAVLGELPRAQLVEVTRRSAIGGFQHVCLQHLRSPTPEKAIASIFEEYTPSRVLEVTQEVGLCTVRNMIWKQISALPGQWKVTIRCPDKAAVEALKARKGPVILAAWHMGVANMLPAGLQAIGTPALVISTTPPSPWFANSLSPEMKIVVANPNAKQPADAVRQALERLKGGGVAAAAVNASRGARKMAVPYFGRSFEVSRSVAVMARITKAPVIPCAMTWGDDDWSMNFRVFDPLPLPAPNSMEPENFEREVLSAVARHFEKFTRENPGQLWLEQLARIVKAPRVAAPK